MFYRFYIHINVEALVRIRLFFLSCFLWFPWFFRLHWYFECCWFLEVISEFATWKLIDLTPMYLSPVRRPMSKTIHLRTERNLAR